MSLRRYYSVVCDGCGYALAIMNSGKTARARAKYLDWKRVKAKRVNRWRVSKPPRDLCVSCARAAGGGS